MMHQSRRELIITADDFGYCEWRNLGILTAFKAGSVSRASLMMNAQFTQEAVRLARCHALPLGLHLNLTEGRVTSDRDDVPSLVNEDGWMLGKMGFRLALKAGQIDLSQVEREIVNQIKRFTLAVGSAPLYVDGHQHVHVLPGVRDVFASALKDHSILHTRLPVEECTNDGAWTDFLLQVCNDACNARTIFVDKGIRFSDGFAGLLTMGRNMTVKRLTQCILAGFEVAETSSGQKQWHSSDGEPDTGHSFVNCDNACDLSQGNKQQTVNVTNTGNLKSNMDSETKLNLKSGDHPSCEPPRQRQFDDKEKDGEEARCNMRSTQTDSVSEVNVSQKSREMPAGPKNGKTSEKNESGMTTAVVELMVHPGYPAQTNVGGCGQGPDEFAMSSDRLHELNILMSQEILDFYKSNGLHLKHIT